MSEIAPPRNRRFVILDRDGTIIVDRHRLTEVAGVALLPGAAAGISAMRALGLGVVVVTNQSVVGRGWLDGTGLDRIHRRMLDLLAAHSAYIDGIYVCRHRPDEGCRCRKPGIGLVQAASRDLMFEPGETFVVGDQACDVELGSRLGATTFMVRSAGEPACRPGPAPDHVVDDLIQAARLMSGMVGGRARRGPVISPTPECIRSVVGSRRP